MASRADIGIVRGLATRYADLASMEIQQERVRRYRKSNARRQPRPIALIDEIPWGETGHESELGLRCRDTLCRQLEWHSRSWLFWQHLPDARADLGRLAPEGRCSGPPWGCKQQHAQHCAFHIGGASEDCTDQSVSARQSRAVWARLPAKVYAVDALRCSRCGSPMKVLALVTDPQQCRRILLHLIKTGTAPWAGLYAAPWAGLYAAPWAGLYAAPPGLDASALN